MFVHHRLRAFSTPTLAKITAVTAGLVAAGFVAAGPANAGQPQDDQLLSAVQQIYPGKSLDRTKVIDNAYATCHNLSHGSTYAAEVASLRQVNPDITLAQAQAETNAEIAAYCPQYS